MWWSCWNSLQRAIVEVVTPWASDNGDSLQRVIVEVVTELVTMVSLQRVIVEVVTPWASDNGESPEGDSGSGDSMS